MTGGINFEIAVAVSFGILLARFIQSLTTAALFIMFGWEPKE